LGSHSDSSTIEKIGPKTQSIQITKRTSKAKLCFLVHEAIGNS
jgi:hypothetical protein